MQGPTRFGVVSPGTMFARNPVSPPETRNLPSDGAEHARSPISSDPHPDHVPGGVTEPRRCRSCKAPALWGHYAGTNLFAMPETALAHDNRGSLGAAPGWRADGLPHQGDRRCGFEPCGCRRLVP